MFLDFIDIPFKEPDTVAVNRLMMKPLADVLVAKCIKFFRGYSQNYGGLIEGNRWRWIHGFRFKKVIVTQAIQNEPD